MMKASDKRRRAVEGVAATLLLVLALVAVAAAVRSLSRWWAVASLAAATVLVLVWRRRLRRRIPRRTVLELDLDQEVVEQTGPFRLPGSRPLLLRDIVDALERAASDERVVGLVARVGNGGVGLARAQELRDAIIAFRAAGKRAVAFAETFGESTEAMADYYLATAFDEVVLQPSGNIGFTGMLSKVTFLRGALDKAGIVPLLEHRESYKAARNRITETGFTPAHRESVTAILESQYDTVVNGIAAARALTPDQIRAAADAGPLLSSEAMSHRMVDRLGYRDEVYAEMRQLGELLYLDTYLRRAGRPNRKGTRVALIHATGVVIRGSRRFTLLPVPGAAMASDLVSAAFREAIADSKVKAIVCRVDSPGGSAVASDVILRHVALAREAGKPVVMTMGDYAASGGYYIASRADRIVAQPGTVTGSIGVVAGKLLTTEAMRRVGVTYDSVGRGANAGFWSTSHDYDERGEARLDAVLDDIYERFLGHVAEGRGMAPERVRELAGGRVWTGAQALEVGLVDALGGLRTALDLTRELLGLEAGAPVKIVDSPRRRRRLPWHRPESSEESIPTGTASLFPHPASGAELVLPAGY